MNVQSGSFVAKALFVIALAVGSAPESHAYAFSDNFDNGVIDTTFWAMSGDGISESGGTLNLSRNDATDSISSLATFSGHFDLSLDMRASSVVWNDMFHGITLVDAANRGISFGFSKYGNFYSTESTGSGTSYYYGDAFTPGAWYTVRLVGDTEGTVRAYVNGGLVFTRNFSNTAAFSIRLPACTRTGTAREPATATRRTAASTTSCSASSRSRSRARSISRRSPNGRRSPSPRCSPSLPPPRCVAAAKADPGAVRGAKTAGRYTTAVAAHRGRGRLPGPALWRNVLPDARGPGRESPAG